VPKSDADPAFWQHMVTFGVSIGLKGRLDPSAGDLTAITNGSKRWGDPTDAEDADRIDDLWHASVNGHGNFVTAGDPAEFAQGLADALATVASRQGSASNVVSSTAQFNSQTKIFQATYTSQQWTGPVVRLRRHAGRRVGNARLARGRADHRRWAARCSPGTAPAA
jgi:type IV pilus assembly protein PilY1